MNIFVCIKQVPATTKVEIDEKTGVMRRSGVESKCNPYDLYALETALRIAEAQRRAGADVKVTAGTMGPGQAEAMLREAFQMGVDEAVLFSDRRFAGADVLATSFALSQGIQATGAYQLILCGKQTTDGDTAQVGPAIAEYLGIPHAAWVTAIEAVEDDGITVEQTLADQVLVTKMPWPCLITVEKDIYQPRLPSYRKKQATRDRNIRVMNLDDFPVKDETRYGLKGSATQVERIFPPPSDQVNEIWRGTADELAEQAFRVLRDRKYL